MPEIVTYCPDHFDGLQTLWNNCFPNDPPRNSAKNAIPQKLAAQPDLLFVALDKNGIIGSIMAGYDGHRGWLYAVAVSKDRRRQGVGQSLVLHAEAALKKLGCNKVNLQVRSGNVAVTGFYEKLGYAVEERVSLGKLV